MAHVPGVFTPTLQQSISEARLLVVGAGGIGCELLKNIVLTGFKDIEVIDLDTIDVSNLNRQFLFQKQHVGKSKSNVARESALRFAPDAKIKAYHDSIMKEEYGVNFYKNFSLCLNALDNRAARNHVNRMCLAANLPLVESGTAGYLGQVTVIRKGATECYECQPKPHQKTFPGCTIRNTPSEPIHCIVWAKHLFNQLFGEDDPDQDVSPDTEDPEAAGDQAGAAATEKEGTEGGNVARKSTKQWAQDCDYSTQKLFQKLFNDDIKYLLSMDKLWAKRRPPTPLDWDCLPDTTEKNGSAENSSNLVDQKDSDGVLVRFEVKSMAGNIIPAIATTNAVIAGCIVMEAIKILNNQVDKCKTVYLRRQPNPRKKILVTESLEPPNPKCYVCSDKPEVNVLLNLETTTIKVLEEKILKGSLNMVAPDVEIEGKGVIMISSEEGDTDCNNDKFLKDFGLKDGSILTCDDFLQNYQLKMILYHADKLDDGQEFILTGDKSQLQPKEEKEKIPEPEKMEASNTGPIDVEDDVEVVSNGDRKRGAEDSNGNPKAKRPKVDTEGDDDIQICESEPSKKKPAPPAAEDGVICIE
ncbi:SUMO-activating enzyme subunit 2 [Eurytemora carolleeae]|uniref:SUMO-activating enzyme subunit 2 n=1 Tax=Eurytemora carolleeae TaxID=1294199 RepID=UPI000C781721|nr:SUMO-activating enzyme subunit 2 [Eurytemora carolleeae]|eukprot:XP_023326854.1 SUMO-activating enzyme subunit 2-like [Eurytemora affinis]